MYGKIEINADLEVVTGLHIGGSSAFAAIGAVDSPVIKDALNNLPMIPGSSLKGKMRTLLAKEFNENVASVPDEDSERLTRLFGTARKGKVKKSRVLFSDMIMKNDSDLRKHGLQSMTEIKFENSINRITAVANPRQIERVVRGSVFGMEILYEIENEEEIKEDFEVIAEGLRLLQFDYLGGHGSRGYGKVAVRNITADLVVGTMEDDLINTCNEILKKAERKD